MIIKWIRTILLTSRVASSKQIKGTHITGGGDATSVGNYYQ